MPYSTIFSDISDNNASLASIRGRKTFTGLNGVSALVYFKLANLLSPHCAERPKIGRTPLLKKEKKSPVAIEPENALRRVMELWKCYLARSLGLSFD
jgi:hypothetical protein